MNIQYRVTIEMRHLRRVAFGRLAWASWTGAMLSLFFGVWIAPSCIRAGEWLLHRIPFWYQDAPFPDGSAQPNLLIGLIWLLYYALAYGYAASTNSPRQEQALRMQVYEEARTRGDDDDDWFLGGYHRPPKPKPAPLSQAWPGELKHQLVERCYQEYRKALQRYDPPPIYLKTPETFLYQKGGHLKWLKGETGLILVLPEEVLTPERIHELLPFLALHLADYNTQELACSNTNAYPDYVPLAFLLFFTGNFLWLPVLVKCVTEGDEQNNDTETHRRHVHMRDEFAVLLGQGPQLEHQLRLMEEELKQRDEHDTSVPTIVERIGRLSVLNERERQEIRRLGLTPKESPLVVDPPHCQLDDRKS